MLYILLIVMVFSNAGETISYKNTKVKDGLSVLFGVTLWSLILSLPPVIFYFCQGGEFGLENFGWLECLLLFVMTGLALASISCWAKASQYMPMSIAEGVSEIYIAFLTLFSWLIFGGKLSGVQVGLLSVVIIACIVLAYFQNRDKKVKKEYNYKIGFIFLFVWVLIYIVRGLIPGALAEGGMNGTVYNFLLNLIMFLSASALLILKKRNIFAEAGKVLKAPWLGVVGLCRTASQISVITLALKMNLGLIDAVSVFGLVIIILYERLIMKEKINWQCYILLGVIAICTALLGILV